MGDWQESHKGAMLEELEDLGLISQAPGRTNKMGQHQPPKSHFDCASLVQQNQIKTTMYDCISLEPHYQPNLTWLIANNNHPQVTVSGTTTFIRAESMLHCSFHSFHNGLLLGYFVIS